MQHKKIVNELNRIICKRSKGFDANECLDCKFYNKCEEPKHD